MSDLHMEGMRGKSVASFPWSEYRGEDLLVLAGDISVGVYDVAKVIGDFLSLGFPHVMYTMGNHECYHHTYAELLNFNKDLAGIFDHDSDKVTLLNCRQLVRIGDVSFFGGTLWTNFNHNPMVMDVSKMFINDFRVIDGFTPQKALDLNMQHTSYIKNIYEQISGKKVIVTHFMPARDCIHPRWKSGDSNAALLNDYFANNLGPWIETLEDTTWIYGHTHDAADFMLGNTRMVCNPKGYARESRPEESNWNPFKTIEI